MDKIKVAKELVKLAKSLVAEYQPSLFNEYHDIDVERCCMTTWFDESIFDSDYERIHYSNSDRNIYLYSNAIGKNLMKFLKWILKMMKLMKEELIGTNFLALALLHG